MTEGDLQKAVDLYLDMGGNLGSTANASSAGSDYRQGLFEEEVREAIPSRYDQLIGGPEDSFGRMQGWVSGNTNIPSLAELEAEAIQDELEDAGLGQLYRPPEDLLATGNLADTMKKAKEEKKWLLVNIQAAEEFASHVLNRDIWSHSTIKEVIKAAFLFWQRDKATAQGSQFVTKYNITEFPAICVLDPRTGRKVKQWRVDKFKGPLSATDILADFLGENPFGTLVPSPRSSPNTLSRHDSMDSSAGLKLSSATTDVAIEIEESPAPAKAAKIHETPLSMPELSNPGEPGEVKVAIRLSNGMKKQVSFKEFSPISVIRQWVSATEQISPSKFEVRLSHPPQPLDMNSGISVGEANVKGALLVVALVNID
jgi:hypothetical protein